MNPNPPTDMSSESPDKCRETVAIMLGEAPNISKLNIEQNEIVEQGTSMEIDDKNGGSDKVVNNTFADKTVLDTATIVATKPPTIAAAAVNGKNQQVPNDNNNKANSNDDIIMPAL